MTPFPDTNLNTEQRKAAISLIVVALSILIFELVRNNDAFSGFLWLIKTWTGLEPAIQDFLSSPWVHLGYLFWWGAWSVLALVLIPCLVIRFIFSEPVSDYGFQAGKFKSHFPFILILAPIASAFIYLVSDFSNFSQYYPMYKSAHRSWADLLAWELIYLSQFMAIEFFYRGFMVQALRPAFGFNAVFVMAIPYMMIHFGKPAPEALGALLGGILLGFLAYHGRTIWSGFILHAIVALSMDFAALIKTNGLPQQFWP